MSRAPTFLEACLAGQALLGDVDDWVDAWHDADGQPRGPNEPLKGFLGFTDTEYALWAERPSMLRLIVAARYQGVDVQQLAKQNDYALAAARTSDDQDVARLVEWLEKTGRFPVR